MNFAGYVETGLGLLHYRESGAGHPLVLLHPAPRSSRVFAPLMYALERLGGIRAIAPDLPGFGNSCELPPGTSMTRIAETIAQFVEALGLMRASVFGIHSGNKIAAALGAGCPGRLDRLVLAGMTHSILLDAEARNRAMRDYVARRPPANPDADPAGWRDEEVDRLLSRGYDALYAANFSFDFATAISSIGAATLVVELVVPQEAALGTQAEAICARLRDGRMATFAGDDREWLQRSPQEAAKMLAAFLLESPTTGGTAPSSQDKW
jgi:pimeloyl-ACP methyl ester carboxylesterase